jgi:lipopolysaccharide heptosyltransferase I
VAIFGPTDPARNGPYRTSNARSIVLRNPASPTTHARRSQPDRGLLEIGVDAVVDAARRLLADGKSGGQECPPHTEGAHG